MKVFLATLLFVGLCVLGLGVNVFFRKKEFPQFDVGSNEEMRKRGIKCMRETDDEIHAPSRKEGGAVCSGEISDECRGCGLYPLESKNDA